MAEAFVPPRTPISPGNCPGASQGLLASCSGTVYLLKNQTWDPLFGTNILRFHLVRQAGKFVLLVVNEQPNLAIKANILLRYNTIFKKIKNNFFSLLDNGVLVWGFDITSQPADAQTFAIVIQNTLTSLKESHGNTGNRPVASSQQPSPLKQEPKGNQQDFLNNVCLSLSDAISRGNAQLASDLARELASQKAAVKIKPDVPEQDETTRGAKDNKINIKVQVEDKVSAGCSFRLDVAPQITINQLKQMVQVKYNFPSEIQRWVIGKRLPKPNESLSDCGIKGTGHTLYLYLVSADSANIEQAPAQAWCGRERDAGLINRVNSDVGVVQVPQNDVRNIVPRNDPRSLPNMASEWAREVPEPAAVGWTCPDCTYVNSPLRPGCEMCSADRPQAYQVPEHYVPDQRERRRLELEQTGERLIFEDVMATQEHAADHS